MAIRRTLFLLFFIAWSVRLGAPWHSPIQQGHVAWAQGFFLLTAAATTLASLACGLQWQNVIAVAAIFGMAGAAGEILWEMLTRGLISDVSHRGQQWSLFQGTVWARTLEWIVIVINARGVARLAFRRWRGHRFVGLWIISAASLLSSALVVNWKAMDTPPALAAPPLKAALDAVGALLVALGLLVAATPWLINKKPVPSRLDIQPMFLWIFFLILPWSRLPLRQNWPPLAILTLLSLPALALAIGKRRWAEDP